MADTDTIIRDGDFVICKSLRHPIYEGITIFGRVRSADWSETKAVVDLPKSYGLDLVMQIDKSELEVVSVEKVAVGPRAELGAPSFIPELGGFVD